MGRRPSATALAEDCLTQPGGKRGSNLAAVRTRETVGVFPGVTMREMMLAVLRVIGVVPAKCRKCSITVPGTWGGSWGFLPEDPPPRPSGKPLLGQRRGRISALCGVLSPGTWGGCGNPSKKPRRALPPTP